MMENKSIGERITQLRQQAGLTQEELAIKCNVATRTIQRIEANQVSPRVYTLRILSEALGADLISTDQSATRNHSKGYVLLWYMRDLFNFKTNRMKKISILSTTALSLFLAIFLISGTSPEKEKSIRIEKPQSGIKVIYDENNKLELIEVVFSQLHSLDTLVQMQADLRKYDIELNYRMLNFTDEGLLKGIEYYASDGHSSGSAGIPKMKEQTFGFYFNYSGKKFNDNSFCIGNCWETNPKNSSN
ncbi:helix-turn-helix domain-containing protein [Marinoscillum sp.]|uniref:helix-turn-helix domain-containing protein n=1 Tax=Marinoscillum sp. TaxID=2024838 RepID=UPI003BA9D84E